MTTAKQINANKQNAKKSSGPTTPVGKAKASQNSIKHGLLSARLLLNDEEPSEFQRLLDNLIASLKPVGALELVLVERIAISLWRQQRLIRAETAAIELSRRTEHDHIRSQVESALGISYPNKVKDSYLQRSPEDDPEDYEYCRRGIDEYFRCQNAIDSGDLARLKTEAPILFETLEWDADESQSVDDFLHSYEGGLKDWASEQFKSWSDDLDKMNTRSRVLAVVELVKSCHSIPSDQDLINRYQTTLDNELHKAIRELREAQEWRLKTIQGSSKPVMDIAA